ncbi:MAG: hypothetical protein AB8B97_19650 [Granulosicoccus sp.]
MQYKVKPFIASDGERVSQLYDSKAGGFPLYYPTAYIARSVRPNATHNTQKVYLESLKRICEWESHREIDIATRFQKLQFLSSQEIDSLTRHLGERRKGNGHDVIGRGKYNTSERSLKAYYNDPAEDARQLDEDMAPALVPLAMAFAGTLIDSEEQASRYDDPTSRLEFATDHTLKSVGHCGKHSFCATTSVPVPCYRCKHFEPLVSAPHGEVLEALTHRQAEEKKALKIGGARNLLVPIDLSADIQAVQNCIDRCDARKVETV